MLSKKLILRLFVVSRFFFLIIILAILLMQAKLELSSFVRTNPKSGLQATPLTSISSIKVRTVLTQKERVTMLKTNHRRTCLILLHPKEMEATFPFSDEKKSQTT